MLHEPDIAGLQAHIAQSGFSTTDLAIFSELLDTPFEFGAIAPEGVEVSSSAGEEPFRVSLSELRVSPEEAPDHPDVSQRVDCLSCTGPYATSNKEVRVLHMPW